MKRFTLVSLVAVTGLMAGAEVLDRPSGIKIGERMTLQPSVAISATYDSNVDPYINSDNSRNRKKDDFFWAISPALRLLYEAESWALNLSAYYNFRQYFNSCHQNLNQHNYGEDLRWNWSNSVGAEKGWTILLGQGFRQITMADDMVEGAGSYNGDSRQLHLEGAIQRRFNEYLHADLNASYYWLDYDEDAKNGYSFYGWDRVLVGAEAGFAPSKWTDFIVNACYQYFDQDNAKGTTYSNSSDGFAVQAGLASYMTERISYRVLAGWSRFKYARSSDAENGFVYTVSGNWKIGETWNTMLLATSYYQPSERQYASKTRVDAVSWGIAKQLVRGKLRTTFDVRYRRETNEYVSNSAYDYTLDIWTGRLGLDYAFCRFMSAFAYGEYQNSSNSEASKRNGAYDYDRWRVTLGLRLTY